MPVRNGRDRGPLGNQVRIVLMGDLCGKIICEQIAQVMILQDSDPSPPTGGGQPCGTPGHPREIRSTVGPIEGAIDTLNEGLCVKRLREKADGPARKCLLLDSRIRKAGNKDDWRSTIFGHQSFL